MIIHFPANEKLLAVPIWADNTDEVGCVVLVDRTRLQISALTGLTPHPKLSQVQTILVDRQVPHREQEWGGVGWNLEKPGSGQWNIICVFPALTRGPSVFPREEWLGQLTGVRRRLTCIANPPCLMLDKLRAHSSLSSRFCFWDESSLSIRSFLICCVPCFVLFCDLPA